MRSTFHGLETARRALATQQTALQTTGHNIANASTPGYTRQRVNLTPTEAYPGSSFVRPQIPGQLGTGVEAGTIERIREGFLDLQYRGENNKFGYWDSKADALNKMEEVLNELTETGLSSALDRFWQSLQDLAVNPDNPGAKSVVKERGIALSETFNYLSTSMHSIKEDLFSQMDVTQKEINAIANDINNLNQQIAAIEPHGQLPNDLYDQRDLLVDRLSELVNIKVNNIPSGGQALPNAEGSYSIEIVGKDGGTLGLLVDARNTTVNELKVNDTNNDKFIDSVSIGISEIPMEQFNSQGKLLGLIESYGYDDGTKTGAYPDVLAKLDRMAYDIVDAFNKVHAAGYGEDGATGTPFFAELTGEAGAAAAMRLSDEMIADIDNKLIAASLDGNPGDGSNALNLADIIKGLPVTIETPTGPEEVSARIAYGDIIGQMAVDTQQANRLRENTETLRTSVEGRRQSVSGVSLDEEMTNMIQYQHAYNAAARMVTAVDEMLEIIINGMGRVGR